MKQDEKILLYGAGGIAAYLFLINPLLKSLGVKSSQTIQQEQSSSSSPFTPTYWSEQQKTGSVTLIKVNTADTMAAEIHDSFGVWQDDFNRIMNVFKQLKAKTQISFLAYRFQLKYKQDFFTFLQNGGGILPWDGLSVSQMEQVISYVNKLKSR